MTMKAVSDPGLDLVLEGKSAKKNIGGQLTVLEYRQWI